MHIEPLELPEIIIILMVIFICFVVPLTLLYFIIRWIKK